MIAMDSEYPIRQPNPRLNGKTKKPSKGVCIYDADKNKAQS